MKCVFIVHTSITESYAKYVFNKYLLNGIVEYHGFVFFHGFTTANFLSVAQGC